MKIGMVSPYDFAWPGGVNAHVSQLSGELRRRGHCVRVIAPYSAPDAGSDVRGLASAEGMNDEFIPIGQAVPLSAGGSKARVTLSWWLYPRVRALMAREDFDVVHLHEPLAPLLPLMVLQHSNAVNIGTFHAYSDRQRLYRLSRRAVGRWQRRLHGRIAVSPAALAFVAPHFPQHAYEVIPNGIDYQRFAEAEPLPELKNGLVNILFVGRKDERKGLRYLLEAFASLRRQRDDVRLIIAGPGKPDRECATLLERIGGEYPGAVVVTGAVSEVDLPRYYASASVFCSPATGGESFGIVLLEAMAAGAPVVASNIDGYRDVVTDGKNGLLTTAQDADALAIAIARIADDTELAQRLCENGQRTAKQYRWERVASEVEAYYRQCIAEAGGGGNAR